MEEKFDLYHESERLIACFPKSFVNSHWEFIAYKYSNSYFRLEDCKSRTDIKCKVLEWLSRSAYKTEPYASGKKNKEFHEFMRKGINEYLGTDFSEKDMEAIYTHVGNRCNHVKTLRFVLSHYNMAVLGE